MDINPLYKLLYIIYICIARDPSDPYNLNRFIDGHKRSFSIAVEEMESGTKLSHWIWFVVPTPPYIVNGVERGSSANQ